MMPNSDGTMSQVQMQQMQQQQQPAFTFADSNNTTALQTITNLSGAINGSNSNNNSSSNNNVEHHQQPIASGNNTPTNEDDGGDEEPLYVNAKQYNRIMKRRQARAKLENDGRIPKNRMVNASSIELLCRFVYTSNLCTSNRKSSCTSRGTSMRWIEPEAWAGVSPRKQPISRWARSRSSITSIKNRSRFTTGTICICNMNNTCFDLKTN